MVQFDIVTYNLKMFPPAAKLGAYKSLLAPWEKAEPDERRMTHIVRLLTSLQPRPAIIFFQELFDNDRQAQCRSLLEVIGYACTKKLDDGDLFHEDSGLLVAVNTATFEWNKRYQYVEYSDSAGADSWSDKGVVGLTLVSRQNPAVKLCVFNSHTQADTDHANIRAKQFNQARKHIKRVLGSATDTAVLFGGDLNVVGDGREYSEMLKVLRFPRDLYRETCGTATTDPGNTWDGPGNPMASGNSRERVDYLLAFDHVPIDDPRSLGAPLPKLTCRSMSVERFEYVSDHYGLRANLEI
jgi:hypothetical protein